MGIAFLFLNSCSKTPLTVRLDDVESYIQSRPDSALVTLRQIDTAFLVKPKEKAQFALLYAMALDKNYIDTAEFHIIRPALDFYRKKGTDKQLMLSYYYAGRILFNAKRDAEALISQTHALEFARKTDSGRYLGMIYTAMADLSSRSFCLDETSEYIKKAEAAFIQADDTISFFLVKGREVNNLSNLGRKDEALNMADSLLANHRIPSPLIPELLLIKAGIMVDTATVNYQPAIDCFIRALRLGGKPTTKQKARYAYALAKCGYQKESSQLFSGLLSANDGSVGTWVQELLADDGQYEEAYRMLRSSLDYQSMTVIQLLNESLFRSQRDYFQTLEKQMSIQKEKQFYLFSSLLSATVLSLVLLTLIVIHLKQRARNKQMEMERLAQSMQDALIMKDQAFSNLQVEFKNMHNTRFRQLEQYYKDFEIARRSGAGEKDLYNKLLAIIHDIEGDTEGQRYLDTLIDQKYNGIMKRLQKELPTLSKQDYLLFSYTAAGFDNSTIGMLLGNISTDAIHMRRSRLRKVFRTQQLPSSDDFIKVLVKRS